MKVSFWMMHTRHAEEGIRLGSHTDAQEGILGLLVDLGLPVVNVILLGYREVAHDGALRIEKLNFRSAFDKAVGNLKLGLEFPSGDTFFLDGEILRQRDVGLKRFGRVGCDIC